MYFGSETKTYAIKIKNINQLQSLQNLNSNRSRWRRNSQRLIEKYNADADGSAEQYQKTFLEFVNANNLGVSLFEMGQENTATSGVNENSTELVLNDVDDVIPNPCNL